MKEYGYNINTDKTKSFNKKIWEIEKVSTYGYLGIKMNNKG